MKTKLFTRTAAASLFLLLLISVAAFMVPGVGGAQALTFEVPVSDGTTTSSDTVNVAVLEGPPPACPGSHRSGLHRHLDADRAEAHALSENLALRTDTVPIAKKPHPGWPLGTVMNNGNRDESFDSWFGGVSSVDDWWGYNWSEELYFEEIHYYPGNVFADGGWWTSLGVQFTNDGVNWHDVPGYTITITPAYDFTDSPDGRSPALGELPYIRRHILEFPPVEGTGLRIYGAPGGTADYTSVAELEVFGVVACTADAGPDQTVCAGDTVTLDGSGSIPPGPYTWTEVTTSGITLSGAGTANPHFVAPSVATTLTFKLEINDGTTCCFDTVNVTVLDGVPPAVTGLTAEGVCPGIELNWNPAPGATSYKILRRDLCHPSPVDMLVGEVSGTSFTDTSTNPCVLYRYTVIAVNPCGESSPSDPAEAYALSGDTYQIYRYAADFDGRSSTGKLMWADGTWQMGCVVHDCAEYMRGMRANRASGKDDITGNDYFFQDPTPTQSYRDASVNPFDVRYKDFGVCGDEPFIGYTTPEDWWKYTFGNTKTEMTAFPVDGVMAITAFAATTDGDETEVEVYLDEVLQTTISFTGEGLDADDFRWRPGASTFPVKSGQYTIRLRLVRGTWDFCKFRLDLCPAWRPEEMVVGFGGAGTLLPHGWFCIITDASTLCPPPPPPPVFRWVLLPSWPGPWETHPALGDLDGDGLNEIVVGFGPGGAGRLELFEDRTGTPPYQHTGSLTVPWAAYNSENGATWPACGDIDGDGKDEIVVGLGRGGSGKFFVFDDASTGFAHYAGSGWCKMSTWVTYPAVNGETRAAAGDIDGDGLDEVVLGLGRKDTTISPFDCGGLGVVWLLDDALAGFPLNPDAWRHVPASLLPTGYFDDNGETWPVTGDIDGDGLEEIVVGLGSGGEGRIYAFDYVGPGLYGPTGLKGGWCQVPWAPGGDTHPATVNRDTDAATEVVVGLGHIAPPLLWVGDHWGTGFGGTGFFWDCLSPIPLPAYTGPSYPRARALMPAGEGLPEVPAQGWAEMPPEAYETFTGTISGNVSSGGGPLEGASVSCYSESWELLLAVETDASGDYSLKWLMPGLYFVGASTETNLAPEYYDDVPGIPAARGSATTVNVYAAIETPGIDFDLSAGASISGTVTTDEPSPSPIVGAIVTAYVEGGSWKQVALAETDASGNYVLQALAPGTYYLAALPPTPDLLAEYYDNVAAIPANQSQATAIPVGPGESVTEKDFALGHGSSISGNVTDDPSGDPIEGAIVMLFVEEGGEWNNVSLTVTDSSGDYVFGGLPAGTYYLQADYSQGGCAGEYYDNVTALLVNRSSATAIPLGEGESATGKDFALAQGGSISGTVRPTVGPGTGIQGVILTVYEQDWGAVAGMASTDASGDYTVGNLPAGQYYVSADGRSAGYTAEYHDNQPMTEQGKANATLVTVSLGVSSVDFTLDSLASISGTVTDDSDPPVPLPYAAVEAIDPQTHEPVASAPTAADGTYNILVEPGSYYVSAEGDGYGKQYYDGKSELGEADLVSPGPGSPVTGVDFSLSEVGSITVVSDVQSAPFTLGPATGPARIEGNTGESRVWESGEVETGSWTITWGAVPGYDSPAPETQDLAPGGSLAFFGQYTLSEGFKVNKLEKTGEAEERKIRIEWYSELGTLYQVQGTNDLGVGEWQNVASPQPGTGGAMSCEELIGATSMRFLRVQAL